jgi:predicted metal-dependent hydrolase
VKATLWNWYREQAADVFQERLRGCMVRLKLKSDEGPRSLIIRSYRSRWGSMSQKRILALNIDLIRAPRECIDYVVIHELCHLKFPHHGPDFWSALEKLMPDWRQRKVKLERITA